MVQEGLLMHVRMGVKTYVKNQLSCPPFRVAQVKNRAGAGRAGYICPTQAGLPLQWCRPRLLATLVFAAAKMTAARSPRPRL